MYSHHMFFKIINRSKLSTTIFKGTFILSCDVQRKRQPNEQLYCMAIPNKSIVESSSTLLSLLVSLLLLVSGTIASCFGSSSIELSGPFSSFIELSGHSSSSFIIELSGHSSSSSSSSSSIEDSDSSSEDEDDVVGCLRFCVFFLFLPPPSSFLELSQQSIYLDNVSSDMSTYDDNVKEFESIDNYLRKNNKIYNDEDINN
ncbi:hypothetical protein DERP_006208 [Dermatophagoides pteronyssinus]|uniref:Uncharacterized protein n=1 Tax=Dermatophagoides pteronyssinus TaxID=6956 RepID=A0ABQ8IXT9_DERPT|nr:hypothetical protein DERP_006208 [Dermatophagoides pteronyssinus]